MINELCSAYFVVFVSAGVESRTSVSNFLTTSLRTKGISFLEFRSLSTVENDRNDNREASTYLQVFIHGRHGYIVAVFMIMTVSLRPPPTRKFYRLEFEAFTIALTRFVVVAFPTVGQDYSVLVISGYCLVCIAFFLELRIVSCLYNQRLFDYEFQKDKVD